MTMPVMGRIAAGTPISAIQNRSHSIAMSPEFLGGGEHYALEVRGDSMIEAGILDGDIVVIRRQDTANTGDIVVALIDDEEATLKRFRRRGSSIALEAANPSLRDARARARPGQDPGQAGQPGPSLLSGAPSGGIRRRRRARRRPARRSRTASAAAAARLRRAAPARCSQGRVSPGVRGGRDRLACRA